MRDLRQQLPGRRLSRVDLADAMLSVLLASAALTVRPSVPGVPLVRPGRAGHVTMAERDPFELVLSLEQKGKPVKCNLKFKPSMPSSETIVVEYGMPFGLNVENKNGRAVCTKAGTGGEQPGDVLRCASLRSISLRGCVKLRGN